MEEDTITSKNHVVVFMYRFSEPVIFCSKRVRDPRLTRNKSAGSRNRLEQNLVH